MNAQFFASRGNFPRPARPAAGNGVARIGRNGYSLLLIMLLLASVLAPPGPGAARPAAAQAQAGGVVYGWGHNGYAELAHLSLTAYETPVLATDAGGSGFFADVIAVSGGAQRTLALKSDGSVWAWGWNDYANLETPPPTASILPWPTQVPDASGDGFLTGVVAIAASHGYHNLALKGDGTVWAWGWNRYGQLGDGTTATSARPVQVLDAGAGFLSGVVAIAAGGYHNLALKGDGTVWAWGAGARGTLGDGTSGMGHVATRPVQVRNAAGDDFLSEVTAISAGGHHSLAMLEDGSLWAWGNNEEGELGNGGSGTGDLESRPVRVHGPGGAGYLDDVTAIAASPFHSMAVRGDGSVWSWGWDLHGQLGDGDDNGDKHTPVRVLGLNGTGFLDEVVALGGGMRYSVALRADGTVLAWGANRDGGFGLGDYPHGNAPVQVPGPGAGGMLDRVSAIASGLYHHLAVRTRLSPTISLTSLANPAGRGQEVSFEVTVSSDAGTPTGSVTFKDGASVLHTVELADGSAGYSTSNLEIGTHNISVQYSGDPNFLPASVTLSQAVGYNVCLLYDPEKAQPRNAAYPVKLQLCDASGANLSGPSISLKVVGVDGGSMPPPASGKANPGYLFRYDSGLGSGGYIYNMRTDGMAAGEHTLHFIIEGGSGIVYSAAFKLK